MTKRTLEYIVTHYTAAMAAWTKCCLSRKCQRCPFVNGNYCGRTNDIRSEMEVIRDYLNSLKGGVK